MYEQYIIVPYTVQQKSYSNYRVNDGLILNMTHKRKLTYFPENIKLLKLIHSMFVELLAAIQNVFFDTGLLQTVTKVYKFWPWPSSKQLKHQRKETKDRFLAVVVLGNKH